MDTTAAAPVVAGNGDVYGDSSPPAHSERALALEEWLASRVLEHVADAREVCRLALINKNFWAASLSDLVWQKRLPSKPVLDAVITPALCTCSSKKDLYMHLCTSVAYENGLKKFWLDPASGGECYMISARALAITWGDTPNYWGWKAWPGAMFPEVACLHAVCWFEIKGTFQQILRPGKYMVSYRMQLHSLRSSWQRSPIKLCLRNTTYVHPPHLLQVLFDNTAFKIRSCPLSHTLQTTDTRGPPSKWVECDAGEFLVEDDNEGRPIEIQFSMQEIEVLWWKRGFVLDGVIIRPSCVADRDATSE